eukprot:TRINITY_DN2314_c0_g1_i1.p2 TRINITY_DN2314_c0_g1~~TRINITY_DN2314_c0_g1_i1.p2  ORF type:complete len:343 (-),score=44.02 TRINITY_DN2314_c0_g1_i1:231-1259(-)
MSVRFPVKRHLPQMNFKNSCSHLSSKLRSHPFQTLFNIWLLLLALNISLLILYTALQPRAQWSPACTFSRSVLLPQLHKQALSHFSFHSAFVKDQLLEALSASHSDSVVVIGVSFGVEVLRFARAHRRVFAFEPMPNSVQQLRDAIEATQPPLDVQIFEMAASDTTGQSHSFNVTYKGESRLVRSDRVDRHIPHGVQIAVMSVDIQGEEYHALEGAGKVLSRVRSLWVEMKACGEHNLKLLRLLDQQYVLFDFVPWGESHRSHDLRHRDSFAYDMMRPADFEAYTNWFCDMKQKHFDWLQTDVLAVRRDVMHGEQGQNLMHIISNIHHTACSNGECVLRQLL